MTLSDTEALKKIRDPSVRTLAAEGSDANVDVLVELDLPIPPLYVGQDPLGSGIRSRSSSVSDNPTAMDDGEFEKFRQISLPEEFPRANRTSRRARLRGYPAGTRAYRSRPSSPGTQCCPKQTTGRRPSLIKSSLSAVARRTMMAPIPRAMPRSVSTASNRSAPTASEGWAEHRRPPARACAASHRQSCASLAR